MFACLSCVTYSQDNSIQVWDSHTMTFSCDLPLAQAGSQRALPGANAVKRSRVKHQLGRGSASLMTATGIGSRQPSSRRNADTDDINADDDLPYEPVHTPSAGKRGGVDIPALPLHTMRTGQSPVDGMSCCTDRSCYRSVCVSYIYSGNRLHHARIYTRTGSKIQVR